MNMIEIRKKLPTEVFTHDVLENVLTPDVKNINAKISYMVKKGELIRLKKGLYAFGEDYRKNPIDMLSVANLLYAPSYVSYEYALSYYGLIPERVYEVTSATLRLQKVFDTPLGRFSYRPVPLRAYALGVDWLYDENSGGKLIATAEKALCDKIRSDRGIGRLTQQKMAAYLEFDLRVDMEALYALDDALIDAIAVAYNASNLKNLAKLISKRRQRA